MHLLLEHHRASLLANGARTTKGDDIHPFAELTTANGRYVTVDHKLE